MVRFGVGVVLFTTVKLPSLVGVISIGIRIWIVNTRLEAGCVIAVAILAFESIIRGPSSNRQQLHISQINSAIYYVTILPWDS